jgi:hypothetical protein
VNQDQRREWKTVLAAKAKATRNQRSRRKHGLATATRAGMVRVNPTQPKETSMTSTTTKTWQEHEQPCFCGGCLYLTVDNLIVERAAMLQAALDGRADTLKSRRELAEELIAAIPAAIRDDVLEHMLEWDHLSPRVMVVDCLLDECDSRSYDALHEMTRILLAAIHAQDAAPDALRILITNEIEQRRWLASARP